MKVLGRHVLTEFYDCNNTVLDSVHQIQEYMEQAARAGGATIIQSVFHTSRPHGVSGVVVIAESHLAIHTWPAYGYAAIDLFTGGEGVDPWRVYAYLKDKLGAGQVSTMEMKRGQLDMPDGEITNKPSGH
ncbi:MAG: S-adenosylmethionine decarboxylase proenzyme precursor [Syntrophorhabdus sp. PtaU1.Bin058]|nr:MAG: S-adenosylmethionine decarboxylase proenzyme precursor [Syntrophorhabdus sp. PtaU1.Bin058]